MANVIKGAVTGFLGFYMFAAVAPEETPDWKIGLATILLLVILLVRELASAWEREARGGR